MLQVMQSYGEELRQELTRDGQDGQPVDWSLWVNDETGSYTLAGTRGAVMCIFIGKINGYAGQAIEDFLDGPSI